MNRLLAISGAVFAAAIVGFLLGRTADRSSEAGGEAQSDGDILYWVAPMDPNYRRNAPGKSPMGMDLVPVYAGDAQAGGDIVAIDPEIAASLGIRTATVERSALSRRIDTVGYVGFDKTSEQHVHARVDGWIERLSVATEGDPVSAGQVLFELYSPALVNAQREFLAALGSRSNGLRAASEERLRALGITAQEIARLTRERSVRERIPYRAERGGVVVMLGVRDGAYVTAATPIVSIASLNEIWVTAEVFERQAPWVKVGQRADIAFDGLPGVTRTGTIDYVYPELDPVTRTLRVRLKLPNPEGALRPNMLARITIYAGEAETQAHVPIEAVIRGGRGERVVLALDGGRFRVARVRTGIESGGRVAILDGLSAGDRVVTSGQFLIDSESNVDSALSRLEPPAGHHDHGPSQPAEGMDHADHAGHSMDGAGPAGDEGGMDHSGHSMDEAGGVQGDADHADHSMGGDGPAGDEGGMDHSDHSMHEAGNAGGDADHAGHSMEGDGPAGNESGMDHSGHSMDEAGHEAHGMDEPDDDRSPSP